MWATRAGNTTRAGSFASACSADCRASHSVSGSETILTSRTYQASSVPNETNRFANGYRIDVDEQFRRPVG